MSNFLLVGLGNPGLDYDQTRHNAGFWFLETLAQRFNATPRLDKAYQARTARLRLQDADVLLCMPQQYMNRSGVAVAGMAHFYRLPPARILVVHDELDLPPGVARLKQGGGHGGHNGLRDIEAKLGSRDFLRLRLGIGHPGQRDEVVNYVLHRPDAEDERRIHEAIERALGVLPDVLNGRLEQAMHRLHTISSENSKDGI